MQHLFFCIYILCLHLSGSDFTYKVSMYRKPLLCTIVLTCPYKRGTLLPSFRRELLFKEDESTATLVMLCSKQSRQNEH